MSITQDRVIERLATSAKPAAALAVCGSIVAIVWVAFLDPAFDLLREREELIVSKVTVVGRLNAVVAYAKDARRTEVGDDAAAYTQDFLVGTEDAIVLAELQTKLRAIVTTRSTEFASARALPKRVVASQSYLGLRLQLRGDMRDIHKILHTVETSLPLLFVERFHIRPDERRVFGPEAAGEPRAPVVAELDVFGGRWDGQVGSAVK